jgi:hypothetical protein
MMWSLFDLFRRRLTKSARPAAARRKAPMRRLQPWLELLEDRTVPTSITASFNSTAVAAGRTLWFSSIINSVSGVGSAPVNVSVTNQTISFTDSQAGTINVSLPNAVIQLQPGGTTSATSFDTTNNQWVSTDPSNLGGNLFLSGYELPLPSGLHGSDSVTWTATFTTDTSGVKFNWAWSAAAYSTFNASYNAIGVKPCDNNTASSYKNSDKAATPEASKIYVVGGAMGAGITNYTGTFTSNTSVTPTYTPIYVTLAGTVYNDLNNDQVMDTGDTGISGVTVNLSGITSSGQSVTATTTTAADGTYSFAMDSTGHKLVAGTYSITATPPNGMYQASNNIGTVNGTADGLLVPGNTIGNITIAGGQSGINYNFGNINPFTPVTPAYPYASTNPLTSVAFNESSVLAGASVNVANGILDMWYSDEHALALGISSVTVIAANGTSSTTNYPTSPLTSDPQGLANPLVGDTATTGDQAATDPSGRLMFPSLYITDITSNPNSTSGDWQNGGTAIAPNALYGTWKSFTKTVDYTHAGAVTVNTGTDPAANSWSQLGAGADTPPAGLNNAGYCTDIQWSLTSLFNQGQLISGHTYRFYFIVHDGDQNNSGGDCGQAAYDFVYRGPVKISGTVYNDLNGSGHIAAGDPGVAGVTLTLTGTTSTGQPVTATTVTAADGSYTFTLDANGNLLQGGTYTITESLPSGFLYASNTVGSILTPPGISPTNWVQDYQIALANTDTSGSGTTPGYKKDPVNSGTDNIYTGGSSKDSSGLAGWLWKNASVQGKDDLADGFAAVVRDPVSGDQVLLSSTDRYDNSGDSTAGYWFYQSNVTQNANGTFGGGHTDGDILMTVDFNGSGVGSIALYRWTGTDATGTLTPITAPNGSMYFFVNPSAYPVPWSFIDKGGFTVPQAGEFMTLGLDLTQLLGGVNIPHFQTFSVETRSSNSPTATLSDLVLGGINWVTTQSPYVGQLVPPNQIGSIVIASGQSGINYNFGLVQPVTVSGLVYTDTNGNGALDAGEPGIAGVTLTLTGTNNRGEAVTATTTTGANGTYSFSHDSQGYLLAPGTYQLVETQPSGYLQGTDAVGTDNGTVDGTLSAVDTISSMVFQSNDNGINYNFGEVQPVTLAGLVYQDTNGNGVQNAGELGIAGVTLTLSGTNGMGQAITATATTAADGTYSFTTDSSGNQLRPGNYTITETQPSGYLLGAAAVGTVNGTADGTIASATQISGIALTSGQSGINYTFGDVLPVSISGTVYNDSNGNGALNAGEPGIGGVTMTLSGTNGLGQAIIATTTTGANGTYSFTTDSSGNQLRPGTYQIAETQPAGYLQGSNAVGTVNGTTDGTLVPTDKIGSIALTSGQNGINYLFGDVLPVTVSGTVYQDTNGNNALDAGEPGIAGVTVTLSGTNGLGQAITATVTTGANGTYSFSTDSSGNQLRPGTYTITETQPSGYLLGAAAVGTVNGTTDGNAVSATTINSIVLTSGQSGINYLFGDVKAVALSGTVYTDTNGNNAFDAGEPGIAGVTVTLGGTNGLGQAITATATTGANGAYSFTTDASGNQLRPGTYTITETQPAGFLLGAAAVGTVNGTVDGNAVSPTVINAIGLTSGQSGINYNFGDYKPVAISGLVYQDTNGNNLLNAGEPGIAGVTVSLSGTNGLGQAVTATATTAANGTFSFSTDSSGSQLRPGNYTITETQPSGYLLGAATLGTVNGSAVGTVSSATKISGIALTSGQSGINYYFGDVLPVSISGTVYNDSNGNGALNAGEPGIGGVTLTLTGTNGLGQAITATTTTAANGTYSFSTDSGGNQIRPGTYQIAETQPAGYLQGTNAVGTVNGTVDGTLVPTDKIGSIVLTSGQNGINYLFGEVQAVTVSGTVYHDINGNNAMDAGEPGIAGVTVTLSGTNGLGQAITATTTTAANGTYSFSTDSGGNQLRPGMYTVTETQPSGYLLGAATAGTVNGTTDGTVASATTINSIVLASGQSGINYLFGDYKPVALNGLVYHDANGNNAFDAGELGMAGVTVTLSGTNGLGQAVSATTTTNASGNYSFSTDSSGNQLRPGTYTITETVPSGYLAGAATVGTVNAVADGTVASPTSISSIALTSGQSGFNYLFGDYKAVSVAGMVYQDTNGNNAFNAGEPGIAGVTLTLTGTNNLGQSITATATTAANGTYTFSTDSSGNQLRPGTYTVTETQPSGYLLGVATVGTVNGMATGSAASATTITSIMLTSGQSGINYLFGDYKPVTLSGSVYQDTNGNNAFDAGEPGIGGVTLTLTGINGLGLPVTATTTTAADGSYSFSTDSSGNTLRPGTYQIAETVPSGYMAGFAAVGTVNGTTDGTLSSATAISSIALTSGQSGVNYLFGDLQAVTIAGAVYQDINGSGAYDAGEPGIAGVTLTLTGTNGLGQSITATATTGANGAYSFTTDSSGNAIRPGMYQIVETLPSGFMFDYDTVGTVNGTADGTAASSSKVTSIVVTSGQSGINYIFGNVKPVSVSGLVYQDSNGNNALDAGEPGIAGVTVTLYSVGVAGQFAVATTTTGANGTYSFTTDSNGNGLWPGSYQVVETQPSGYLLGAATVGTVNGSADGTVISATTIGSIALTSGQAGINYDFGDYKPVTLAGTVYHDTNGNNAFDSGEPGISGVTVTLTGTNGLGQSVTATATTGANGTYSFSTDSSGNTLRPGTYTITETQPSGYLLGAATVGTVNGAADGTVVSATTIGSIAMTSGQSGISYNFGDYKPVAVSGLVYEDINGNGALDSGEPGIAGVALTLSGTNGLGQSVSATTTTAADGTYTFSTDASGNTLRPGNYTITETQPAGYLLGSATVGTVNGTTDGTASAGNKISSIAMTSGQSGINYLFGDVKAVTISGLVYQDTNGNGALDSGEPGLAGVTMTLTGTNGLGQSITATATTAADGTYTFSTDTSGNALRPGTYQIVETVPPGYLTGTAAVGTVNGVTDGNVFSPTTINAIGLTSGQSGINYMFGDVKGDFISGTVYQDSNANNAFDAGEPGIAGVTLTLTGVNNLGQSVTATTTTAANGTYAFGVDSLGNPLRPGTYQVVETQPSGYLAGATSVGTVNSAVDGTVVSSGTIGSIVLTSGQSGINYNFGDYKPVTISGTAYVDSNANGAFDSGEPGIAGVTVTLTGINGLGQAISVVATTAANGTYSFSTDGSGNTLRPGTYQVSETLPSGYLAGATTVGTVNGASDGTVVTTGTIGSIVMTSGQGGINYNFGQLKPVTISGLVYIDPNGSGSYAAGDTGFANVTVTLSGTNGLGQAVTATTTTAADGSYSFSTDSHGNVLRPGTYQITATTPTGYVAVAANVGTVNGTVDGNAASANSINQIGMSSGQAGINYDFGVSVPASVSGYVYIDYDGSQTFSANNAPMSGVTVIATSTTGLRYTTTTDNNGFYIFANLANGTYTISIVPPGGTYNPDIANVGTVNGSADGTANANEIEIDLVQLHAGQKGINYDFGIQPPFE